MSSTRLGDQLSRLVQAGGYEALVGRLRNIGHLLTGNFASAILSLVAIALTARGLGPASYGILAIAFAYARTIERLVSFQSWQPLIRYGASLQEDGRHEDLKSLMKFGLLLDMAGALLALLIGLLLAMSGARLLDMTPEVQTTFLICCLMLPFNLNGMPTAALRLHGSYRLAAWGPVCGAAARLIGSAIALANGGGLVAFAAVWAGSQVIGSLLFLSLGFRVLRDRGLGGILSASVENITTRFSGIWRFAWISNVSFTLRSSADQFDVIIVGALAGPAAAGFYHIAKRAGRLAEQVSTQAQAVLFPDIARLWNKGDRAEMRRAIRQLELLLFGFGALMILFFLVAARPIIGLTAGAAFTPAAPLLVVQMVAVTLAMTGSGSRSALLAIGREKQVLKAVIAGTMVFHALAFTLVPQIGAMGANLAHIGLGLIASGLMVHWCRTELRQQA